MYGKKWRGQSPGIDIYPYIPPDKIWQKVFFKVGIKGAFISHTLLVMGSLGPKARWKWVTAGHWFTKYNVIRCLKIVLIAFHRVNKPKKNPKCDASPCLTRLVSDSSGQKAEFNVNLYLSLIPANWQECHVTTGNRRRGETVGLIFISTSNQIRFDTRFFLKRSIACHWFT